METISLKLIPGDGIGVDVINEGKKILKRLEDVHGGIRFAMDELDWSCEYYLKHGSMMPSDGMKILEDCDSILLGAVGFPGVPDHVSLSGLLLPIRQQFEQYVNMRPIKLLEGLDSPVKVASPSDIDFVVVRENSEGEYCGKGRIINPDSDDETVIQEAWFSRKATSRIIKYAFEYAQQHGNSKVTGATKSNALNYSMVFWDKVFNEVKTQYPDMETALVHVDALAGFFIMKPQTLQVVVASNLFGDILTDLGSAMLGSIGISPSANINPDRKYPSMFEPIHGSAPDIAGKGIANPTGTIWSIVMMLDHLGLNDIAKRLMDAMCAVIAERKIRTPDIGGTATTTEMTDAIISRI